MKTYVVVLITSASTMYSDKQPEQTVDSYEMLRNVASDQGPHCLPFIYLFLDTLTGSRMDLLRF